MNTIYDGSFVLGQTSVENPSLLVNENSEGNVSILQGTVATSAGIVGDGTTQNPLRADETVLWSGTVSTTGGSYPLVDKIQNFSKIKVYGKWNGNYAVSRGESVQEFTIDDAGQAQLQYYPVFSNILSNIATQNIVAMYFYSDKTFNLGAGTRFVNGTATTGVNNYDFNITKVVGINRIANS